MQRITLNGGHKTCLKIVVLSLALIALCAGFVMAWLTASDAAVNKFSLARSLDVKVVEQNWDALADSNNDGIPDAATNMVPLQSVPKDPALSNLSNIDAYAFVEVTIPVRNVRTADAAGNLSAPSDTELFTFSANTGDASNQWTYMAKKPATNGVTYIYSYNSTIASETTTPLFDSVTLANLASNEISPTDLVQEIEINGHAIQASGFASSAEAWSAFTNGSASESTNNAESSEGEHEDQPGANEEGNSGQESSPVAFAVYSNTDKSLRFYNTSRPLASSGSIYEGREATNVYTDIATTHYSYDNQPGWLSDGTSENVESIIVEDNLAPISISYWCADMPSLASADFTKLDTSYTVGMEAVFANDASLSLDCSSWNAESAVETVDFNLNASSVIAPSSLAVAFAVFSEDDNSLNFYKDTTVPSVGEMYKGLTVGAVYDGVEQSNYTPTSIANQAAGIDTRSPWLQDENFRNITSISVKDAIAPQSTKEWFTCCYLATNVDLTKLNMSKCKNASSMFCDMTSIETINVSGWNMSGVTDISWMFSGCTELKRVIGMDRWNVSSVVDASYMFAQTNSVVSIGNLSSWNVSSLENAEEMLADMWELTSIGDLSSWNVSNVTNMRAMFSWDEQLTGLGDLSGWNVSKVTNMENMFNHCSALTTIGNVSGWNTSNVQSMKTMFENCSKLVADCTTWNTSACTSHKNFNASARYVSAPTWIN